MSKSNQNYGWLNNRPNSAKTLIARAKREVPRFAEHIRKFEHQIAIKSYSESTVFSYSRSIAQISLYFKKSPLDLDADEINSYLYTLRQDNGLSDTYFKHAVYGLRFFYRVYDLEDRAIRLPNLKNNRKLPVVFSQEELRRLFKAPQRLKQRVLLSLIYSAGLRVSEVCKLKIFDIDFHRNQIHIRQSKNNKSRYENPKTMSKLDKLDKILIILFIISVTMAIITSCQPTDPLKGLNCPCKVITAEITPRGHKVTYIDKDGKEQTVISKALYNQYHN